MLRYAVAIFGSELAVDPRVDAVLTAAGDDESEHARGVSDDHLAVRGACYLDGRRSCAGEVREARNVYRTRGHKKGNR